MTAKKATNRDADRAQVERAMSRAARRARDLARQTRTPLIIMRNGELLHVRVDDEPESPVATPATKTQP